ncbi:hypothetical protein TrST_g13775 [Triparma strigata]|uniref:Uncharacterized protein n=1 Tax=Triparma strigata TaxID=1606541 RepID=A0A9W7A1L5_9STRA|nr:hypothetical protein TrST_g13775 [Triparma strigata]
MSELRTLTHGQDGEDEELGGRIVHLLRMELEKEKKLKGETESELAAERLAKETALREKEAALRENTALREKEAVLTREKEAVLEEQKKIFSAVMSRLEKEGDAFQKKLRRPDGADSSSAPAEPLNRATPGVKKVGDVLSENTTINNCRTNVTIHEDPKVLLEAILSDQMKVGKTLYQKTVEEGIFYWSFMVSNTKSCDLLMSMRVERQDEDRVVVRAESVEEEGLEATSLPNPHSTASKKLRLLLKEGKIILQPHQFRQTSFTFMGQVDVGEVAKDAATAPTSLFRRSKTSKSKSTTTGDNTSAVTGVTSSTGAAVKILGAGTEADKATELFCRLANLGRAKDD